MMAPTGAARSASEALPREAVPRGARATTSTRRRPARARQVAAPSQLSVSKRVRYHSSALRRATAAQTGACRGKRTGARRSAARVAHKPRRAGEGDMTEARAQQRHWAAQAAVAAERAAAGGHRLQHQCHAASRHAPGRGKQSSEQNEVQSPRQPSPSLPKETAGVSLPCQVSGRSYAETQRQALHNGLPGRERASALGVRRCRWSTRFRPPLPSRAPAAARP